MKVIVVGDIHLHRKKLQRSAELLKRIGLAVEATQAEALILLGDVFDHHRELYSDLCTVFHEFLETQKIPIYILVGNHDMHDSRTFLPRFHALQAYKKHARVTVVDQPIDLTLPDGTILGFVPYVPNGMFKECLKTFADPPHVIFAHQEFKDCQMGFFKSEHGDENPEMQVISGHIHGEQTVGNVWYIGTPCQQNFAEDNSKSIGLIEISGGSYKLLKKINLKMPEFVTIESTTEEFPVIDSQDGNSYRIIVKGTPEKIVMYKQTPFYKSMNRSVKFKFDVQRTEAVRTENDRNLNFQERFEELVHQEGLMETYEIIFEKFQESRQS